MWKKVCGHREDVGSLLKRLSASSCERKSSINLNRPLACSIVGISIIQRNWYKQVQLFSKFKRC